MTALLTDLPEILPKRRWTREEYYKLSEIGMFEGQHIMLIDGEIIEMPAHNDLHAWGVTLLTREFLKQFGDSFTIRPQLPLNLGERSDPEPDLAVIKGPAESWRGMPHPTYAVLVVEISDTTLRYDQRVKTSLYAAHDIADYWIVNLIERQIEVYRNPVADPATRFGWRYEAPLIHPADSQVAPLARPDISIRVANVLP